MISQIICSNSAIKYIWLAKRSSYFTRNFVKQIAETLRYYSLLSVAIQSIIKEQLSYAYQCDVVSLTTILLLHIFFQKKKNCSLFIFKKEKCVGE